MKSSTFKFAFAFFALVTLVVPSQIEAGFFFPRRPFIGGPMMFRPFQSRQLFGNWRPFQRRWVSIGPTFSNGPMFGPAFQQPRQGICPRCGRPLSAHGGPSLSQPNFGGGFNNGFGPGFSNGFGQGGQFLPPTVGNSGFNGRHFGGSNFHSPFQGGGQNFGSGFVQEDLSSGLPGGGQGSQFGVRRDDHSSPGVSGRGRGAIGESRGQRPIAPTPGDEGTVARTLPDIDDGTEELPGAESEAVKLPTPTGSSVLERTETTKTELPEDAPFPWWTFQILERNKTGSRCTAATTEKRNGQCYAITAAHCFDSYVRQNQFSHNSVYQGRSFVSYPLSFRAFEMGDVGGRVFIHKSHIQSKHSDVAVINWSCPQGTKTKIVKMASEPPKVGEEVYFGSTQWSGKHIAMTVKDSRPVDPRTGRRMQVLTSGQPYGAVQLEADVTSRVGSLTGDSGSPVTRWNAETGEFEIVGVMNGFLGNDTKKNKNAYFATNNAMAMVNEAIQSTIVGPSATVSTSSRRQPFRNLFRRGL